MKWSHILDIIFEMHGGIFYALDTDWELGRKSLFARHCGRRVKPLGDMSSYQELVNGAD